MGIVKFFALSAISAAALYCGVCRAEAVVQSDGRFRQRIECHGCNQLLFDFITDFFKQQLQQFMTDELDPLGRQIIELVMNDAPLEDFVDLTPLNLR